MLAARIHSMQRRDWAFLIVLSLVVAFCGVFGASYVLGAGYPYFKLWAELLLTLLAAIIVAIAFLFIEAAFAGYAYGRHSDKKIMGSAALSENSSDEPTDMRRREEGTARSSARAETSSGRFARAQDCLSTDLLPESRIEEKAASDTNRRDARRIFNILTPSWSLKSIALFSLVMAALWLPWYIANFPGGTYWDTYYQMYQVYPENHPIAVIPWAEIYSQTLTDAWLVDHHPVFTTFIYGAFAWVSDQLTGNWMAGVAAFCIIQGIAHVVAFTASVAYLRKVGCPPLLNFLAFAYLALAPFVSTWALCMVKDSFFGLFYIPYFMLVFETVRTRGECMRRHRNIVLFALCALMLCLTKKTGIFVVIPTAIVGAIAFRRSKPALEAYLFQGLLPAIVVLVLFPVALFPALNIQAGGAQETLGPLFQQTARTILDYPDDVTPEEEDAIRAVLDYDKLAKEYQFDFEDSVKYRYNLDASTTDIVNYMKAYAAMGMRHPDSYFGAAMALAGFYVAPTAPVNIRMVTVDTKMGPDQRYMLWNPDELDWLRNGLDDAYDTISKIPVIDLPLLIVTYAFWLPALLAFVAFRNRLKCWTLFVPPLVLLAFCIIAPVYDARYVVPILDAAPLFFCGVVVLLRNRGIAQRERMGALGADSNSTMEASVLRRNDVRTNIGREGPKHARR